ncbi:hypothetical protein [Lentzea sp. NPDC059081]|uniref:hypothetical protein n=1 Tax=Lentzea sp. NPDC059081 TaxID=3346719 RepID=UPI0036B66470
MFLLMYTGVTALRHPRPVIADRVAAAVVHGLASLLAFGLMLAVGFTFYRGATALGYLNFVRGLPAHRRGGRGDAPVPVPAVHRPEGLRPVQRMTRPG